jgi:serine/threonine-protein kinase SRPK3
MRIKITGSEFQSIDEEHVSWFNPMHFFQVQPGEFYNGRYKTIAKLGHGGNSTVWLAQDLQ